MRIAIILGCLIALTGCSAPPSDADVEVITVRSSTDCPTSEAPYFVKFTNHASKPLRLYSYQAQMRRRGHSAIILAQNYQSDRILGPGESDSVCLPRLLGFDPHQQTSDFSNAVLDKLSETPEIDRAVTAKVFEASFRE